ncbi:hypothetical protein HMPREF3033_00308, partial [Veillonellaceae bacterium DNF00751]
LISSSLSRLNLFYCRIRLAVSPFLAENHPYGYGVIPLYLCFPAEKKVSYRSDKKPFYKT